MDTSDKNIDDINILQKAKKEFLNAMIILHRDYLPQKTDNLLLIEKYTSFVEAMQRKKRLPYYTYLFI